VPSRRQLEKDKVPASDVEDDEEDEKRDFLGEMLIAAIMMITGGEAAEVQRMSRADRYLVTRAIINASIKANDAQRAHPLTQDVALELMGMVADTSLSVHRQVRAEEMGQSMMSFTTGLRASFSTDTAQTGLMPTSPWWKWAPSPRMAMRMRWLWPTPA
jgi:hypothetical protein